MAYSKAIVYASQVQDLILESVQFSNNNVVENFNYPQNVSTYKNMGKFLKNRFMAEAFSKTPLVIYQNYLREFWCTAAIVRPTPPTKDSEQIPLKESGIRFTLKNEGTPLYLDYKIFCQSTRLEYNNVQPIELAEYMLSVVNHQASVSPTPTLEKVGKKKKSPTVTKPLPKSQGPKASGVPPNVTKGKKQPKTKKTSLIQSTLKFTDEKEPSKATDTSRSVSSSQSTNPQDIKGNKQPTIKGFPSNQPKDDYYELSKMAFTSPSLCLRETPLIPKIQRETYTPLSATNPDKGHAFHNVLINRFEVSDPNQNKGNTSLEVEPDNQPLIQTYGDFQMVMADSNDELKELSDDDIFKAREDMDDPFLLHSPSPNKDHLESSKEKQHKKSDQSPDASDFESSSCSKPLNLLITTCLKLNRHLEKHDEVVDSSTNLRMEMNAKGINRVLTYLKEVHDYVKKDHVLNKKVLNVFEEYTKNSSNLTELLNLVKDFDFPVNKGNGIAKESYPYPPKLVKASKEIRLDPDAPVLIDFKIDRKMHPITHEELQALLDKKEQHEQAVRE
ncbi:hypothetical protein Tco_0768538 [Tanacetum coccineum]